MYCTYGTIPTCLPTYTPYTLHVTRIPSLEVLADTKKSRKLASAEVSLTSGSPSGSIERCRAGACEISHHSLPRPPSERARPPPIPLVH